MVLTNVSINHFTIVSQLSESITFVYTIAERLKSAREAAGLTQPELAKRAGVSPGTIGNIESGARQRPRELLAIAREVKVNPHWLESGKGPRDSAAAANTESGPEMHGPYPLISDVQAGAWTAIVDNFQTGEAEEWLSSVKDLGPNGYLLRVTGDSMTCPGGRFSFPSGMILHVNPSLVPRPGQFVIVRRNGNVEGTFKRYVLLDGQPYLEAINPDWPKEKRFLELKPGDDWCGVVVDASLGDLP